MTPFLLFSWGFYTLVKFWFENTTLPLKIGSEHAVPLDWGVRAQGLALNFGSFSKISHENNSKTWNRGMANFTVDNFKVWNRPNIWKLINSIIHPQFELRSHDSCYKKMKWSRDHGLTCGLKRENKCWFLNSTRLISTWWKVQAVFSGFDLCDLEKSVKTDMCNTSDVTSLDTQSERFVTLAVIITSEMVLLHLTNAP